MSFKIYLKSYAVLNGEVLHIYHFKITIEKQAGTKKPAGTQKSVYIKKSGLEQDF